MSVELRASIICDSCGDRINGDIHDRTSDGDRSYWDAKTKAKDARWIFQQRYGSTIHLCQKCADSGKQVPQMPVVRTVHFRYLVQQEDGRMLCMGGRSVESGHNFSKAAEELSEYFGGKTEGDEWKGGRYVEILRGWKSKTVLASAGIKK